MDDYQKTIFASMPWQEEKNLQSLVAVTSGITGQALLDNIVRWVASWFDADVCLVSEIKNRVEVNTASVYAHGQLISNFSFQLPRPLCDHGVNGVITPTECVFCAQNLAQFSNNSAFLGTPPAVDYLALPISNRQHELLGLLVIFSRKRLYKTPQRIKLLELPATILASEFERSEVETQLRRRDNILNAVSSCASLLLRAERLDHVISSVVDRLGRAAEVSRTSIFENSSDASGEILCSLRYSWVADGIRSQVNDPHMQNSSYRRNGFARWLELLNSRQVIASLVRDLPAAEKAILAHAGIKSTLSVPIFIEERWWGFLSFDDCTNEREWSSHEIEALLAYASVIAAAIQRRQGEKRLRQAATMFENTVQGVIITDKDGCIEAVNQAFSEITGYSETEVVGKSPKILDSGRHDREFYADVWQAVLTNGRWHGEIWNRRKSHEIYPSALTISTVKDQNDNVLNYIAVFSDLSEIKQAQHQLHYISNHDPLTELPNRQLFQELLDIAISRAYQEKQAIGVLVFNLDRFKQINDSLGHPIGNALLQTIAKRLYRAFRRNNALARLVGDQFALFIEDLDDAQQMSRVARRLLEIVHQPVQVREHEFYITASVGIALYPDDSQDGQTLIRNAESAMHKAKAQGRNTYKYYSAELTTSSYERLFLETQLRRALKNDELLLYYQPQVLLDSGRIIGAEALLRWQHSVLDFIAPERFIPIAEESGLIVPIGAWVLRSACRQAKVWRDAGLPLQSISVNIAGPQFEQQAFIDTVRQALAETGLEPEALELEITETFISHRFEHALAVLHELRQLGVKLSIDDFGTGYSSMMYLKQLPINKLKIDRSFVQGLPDNQEDAAIAKAIIALGKGLDFTIIAEGIEKSEQQTFLRVEGCDQGQGFLHSRPIPAVEFGRLLAANASTSADHSRFNQSIPLLRRVM